MIEYSKDIIDHSKELNNRFLIIKIMNLIYYVIYIHIYINFIYSFIQACIS
jgi:Sec-independent protein secretion pathway component TatC